MDARNLILEIVKEKHKSSDGKCGTYVIDIKNNLDLTVSETEDIVIELLNSNEVDLREGIHGAMLMKKAK